MKVYCTKCVPLFSTKELFQDLDYQQARTILDTFGFEIAEGWAFYFKNIGPFR